MTIELQNQAKISINTNEIKEIQFTEGKIVIADLDFSESMQSILDTLALYCYQSKDMSYSNAKEIQKLKIRIDSLSSIETPNLSGVINHLNQQINDLADLVDFYHEQTMDSLYALRLKDNNIGYSNTGSSDSIKMLYDNYYMTQYRIDNIVNLIHNNDSISRYKDDELACRIDSIAMIDYENEYESRLRDEYLINNVNMLFQMNNAEMSGVKSFYLIDDEWGYKEYNYNWDGRYGDWW